MLSRNPARVVAPRQVMLPGLVVHAVRELHEEHEVLRAQLEAIIRAAEIEAPVLTQLALGVLAQVTAAFSVLGAMRSLNGGWRECLSHTSASPAVERDGLVRRREAAFDAAATCAIRVSGASPTAATTSILGSSERDSWSGWTVMKIMRSHALAS